MKSQILKQGNLFFDVEVLREAEHKVSISSADTTGKVLLQRIMG